MIYGVDIGGSKIELVVFDAALAPVERERIATPTQDYQAFLAAVGDLVGRADARFGGGWPIGIGIPGLVDGEGRSFCANVPCATGQTVAPDLAQRLGRTVVAENDCRLFALSEATGGAGDEYRTTFGAILGTGAGAGLVIDGRLERGARGLAGEYGHVALPAVLQQHYDLPIWTCGCGLAGCMEAYIAGPGLLALARHRGIAADGTADVVERWRGGDEVAQQLYRCFLDILGASLATVVKLIDPDVIVMGGGLSRIPEVIADLPAAVAAHLFRGFAPPPIVVARFGDSSGVRGAALLARDAAA